MSDTAVLDRPQVAPPETEEDPEKAAHIVVPAAKVTEAYVMGTPVTALCGHTFVPTKDPTYKPICQACRDIMDALVEERWGLSDR